MIIASNSTAYQRTANISSGEAIIKTSNNGGTNWQNQNYTPDLHIHQYSQTDSIRYNGCIINSGVINCSEAFNSDNYDLTPLPPSSPIITNPSNSQNLNRSINITWLPSTSPTNESILSYSIDLLNPDNTFNSIITTSNNISNNTLLNTSSASFVIVQSYTAINYPIDNISASIKATSASNVSTKINLTYWDGTSTEQTIIHFGSSWDNITLNNSNKEKRIANITIYLSASANQVNMQNTSINPYLPSSAYNLDLYSIPLNLSSYKIRVTAKDNQSSTSQAISELINESTNAQLNISLSNPYGAGNLTDFKANLTNINTSTLTTGNTSIESLIIYIIKNQLYNITIDKTGYAINPSLYESNASTEQNLIIPIYTENSVYITIRDENTGNLINNTAVQITFIKDNSTIYATTNNGTHFQTGLNDGTFEIRFNAANYTYRTYTISVNNRSFQNLNAYLISTAYTTIFNIMDSITLTPLPGVTFAMEKLINGSWTTTESKTSDISGSVQVGYTAGQEYRFTLTKSGYTSKTFNLNPIIYASYNVYLDKNIALNYSGDYTDIAIVFYPKTFYNGTNFFIWQISSPKGELINYGISARYPGGSQSGNGVNAVGESFNLTLNIINATIYDRVNISYYYQSTMTGRKTFNFSYEIIGAGVGATSPNVIANLKNKDYGLGAFEKLIIVYIALILIAGFAYALTGFTGSLAISVLILGVAGYLGFLTIWVTIISIMVSVLLLIALSIGNNT